MKLFRKLTTNEERDYRRWARDNYLLESGANTSGPSLSLMVESMVFDPRCESKVDAVLPFRAGPRTHSLATAMCLVSPAWVTVMDCQSTNRKWKDT